MLDMVENEAEETAPALGGDTAAAILLMLLGEGEAAAVLRELEPGEVRRLGSAMLGVANAGESEIEAALDQFVVRSRAVPALAVGVGSRVRSVMTEALGDSRASSLLASIAPRDDAVALEALRWMDEEQIAALLANEHPQVGALVLANLSPEMAAGALATLDETHQTDLVLRAARLSRVSAAAIADLGSLLANATATTRAAAVAVGGASDAARIVSSLRKPDEQRVLKSLKKRDRLLGQEIEDEMLVFENLSALDAKGMSALLRSVDSSALSVAMRGASAALCEQMFAAMSTRAAQTIRDEMLENGPVKRADVEAAQKTIVAAARRMAESGEVMLGGRGDDYV